MREPQKYEDLFFTDDFMFCKIMENDEHICRRVIEVLLGIQVERIEYTHKQETLDIDIESRGVRLDVVAKGDGKIFDLEMQTTAEKNLPKRARYYQSMMDMDCLAKGQDYDNLPESFVVFICTQDPFGLGLPRYTIEQTCKENPEANNKIDDKIRKVYYNSKAWEGLAKDDAEVRAFLKFLATQKAESKLTEEIMEAVMTARRNEPWRKEFMHARELRERGRKEGYEEGLEEGIEQGRAEERAIAQAQLAADQTEIAALKIENSRIATLEAEIERLKNLVK